MRRHLVLVVALAALARVAHAGETSWIFRPAAFTHDGQTGERIAQFAESAPAYVRDDPTYQESGYVHSRWTRLYGDSADHMHVVQTWGQGDSIRPYGEWLYPYRPGAVPDMPWGYPDGYQGGYPGPYPGVPGAMPYGPWANPYGPNPYGGPVQPYGTMGPSGAVPQAPVAPPAATPPAGSPRSGDGRPTGPAASSPPPSAGRAKGA